MKTINKMKNINSRVIDCSLNKLFETLWNLFYNQFSIIKKLSINLYIKLYI